MSTDVTAITFGAAEFDFDFDFEIPNIYGTLTCGEPLPEFNIDAQTLDPDSLVTPLEGGSADAFQIDTAAPFEIFNAPGSATNEHEKSTIDECVLPLPKVRKLSASRWVPCAVPKPQCEPSRWFPVAAPSNLAPSFAIPALPQYVYPDPQKFGLPYHYPSPPRVMPGHNFSAVTPPGRQTASLPIPGFMYSGVVPNLMKPRKGRYRHMDPVNDISIAGQPQAKKQKRDASPVADHDVDHESDSAIFSGRRPPKKVGRSRQYKSTEVQRERSRKRYKQSKKLQENTAKKSHQVAERAVADSSRETSPEYVLGASKQEHNEDGLLRRSSRQSKPRFPELQF